MAAREFHGVIHNQMDETIFWHDDKVDDGDWQDPWYPSIVPGAGKIEQGNSGEWRTESDGFFFGGVFAGTSGWGTKVGVGWRYSKLFAG